MAQALCAAHSQTLAFSRFSAESTKCRREMTSYTWKNFSSAAANGGKTHLSLCQTMPCQRIRDSRQLAVTRAATEAVDEETELIEQDTMERMEKSLEKTRSNFNTVRTGRATPSLLDRIEVEYYGTEVTLKSIAQISAQDGSTLLVTPFDKSSIPSIEKAIMKSDVGLTPNSDGAVIRLSVPQLTADRRKELLKTVSKLTEDGKVAIRNVRRDALKAYDKLEKEKKISSDENKDLASEIQKLTDDYVKQIDALFKTKEKELTTV